MATTKQKSNNRQQRTWMALAAMALLLSLSPMLSQRSQSTSAQTQRGKASYYSRRATGARTASGTKLHHDSMTCAHRTFPFGTMLKVTNLNNGKSVVVKVTDRGPYGRGRIIDLSWGAAKAIDMIAQGVVAVVVERLKPMVYPLKPEDDKPDLPEIDFEIANIETGIIPVWQEMDLDSSRIDRQMQHTSKHSQWLQKQHKQIQNTPQNQKKE